MHTDVLNTMFYLLIILLGIPTAYFLSSSGSSSEKNKRRALKVYPLALFLVILITILLYGVEETKRAIGHAFGNSIIFLFYAILILGLIIIALMLLLGNWKMLFNDMKRKLMRKRK